MGDLDLWGSLSPDVDKLPQRSEKVWTGVDKLPQRSEEQV